MQVHSELEPVGFGGSQAVHSAVETGMQHADDIALYRNKSTLLLALVALSPSRGGRSLLTHMGNCCGQVHELERLDMQVLELPKRRQQHGSQGPCRHEFTLEGSCVGWWCYARSVPVLLLSGRCVGVVGAVRQGDWGHVSAAAIADGSLVMFAVRVMMKMTSTMMMMMVMMMMMMMMMMRMHRLLAGNDNSTLLPSRC